MPDLILFAACSRVILDAQDDTLTLVGLLERVVVEPDASGNVPAVADVTWQHVAIWQAAPGDQELAYEQRIEVVRPDRRVAAEIRQALTLRDRALRVYGAVAGFPAELEGDYRLRLSLRVLPDDDAWQKITEYPVSVLHRPAAGLTETPQPLPGSREPEQA